MTEIIQKANKTQKFKAATNKIREIIGKGNKDDIDEEKRVENINLQHKKSIKINPSHPKSIFEIVQDFRQKKSIDRKNIRKQV